MNANSNFDHIKRARCPMQAPLMGHPQEGLHGRGSTSEGESALRGALYPRGCMHRGEGGYVEGKKRNNDVSHYLVDGQLEFIKVAVQLVNVGVVIVHCICELLQAAKLYDCHRHKPVSENNTIRMTVRGSPRQKSAPYQRKFT